MKTTIFLRGLLVMAFMIVSFGVMAQGRGRSNGRDRGHTNGYQRDVHHHHNHDRHNKHDSHRDVYVHHHHDHVPTYRKVTYHHHHQRPVRYVYYRDYDVYYDCDRSVYISYSGHGWTISNAMPVVMCRVDIQRAVRVDVNDYYDDDFAGHLDRRRPNGRLYAEW